MENCIFCQIISGKIPTDFVYDDKKLVVFTDIIPSAPVHLLIVPREHIAKLQDLGDNNKELLGHILLTANKVAKMKNIEKGFKIVINCGSGGGQEVPHLHVHLLGGWRGGVK